MKNVGEIYIKQGFERHCDPLVLVCKTVGRFQMIPIQTAILVTSFFQYLKRFILVLCGGCKEGTKIVEDAYDSPVETQQQFGQKDNNSEETI